MPESAPPIPKALAELQSWPHWVVWRVERRDDKTTKVPYQAAHPSRKASSTDASTWGTYEQALAAVGRADGVGYVFAPDDEYCGVDLDKCVEPADSGFAKALGPTIREPARRFVATLDSYTELSPTGTGLHIIVRGRVNGSRNRTGKTPWGGEFEVYDHARFFTITGEHLAGTPTAIEARQVELDAIAAELFPGIVNGSNGTPRPTFNSPSLDDVELIEKLRASKQGARFAELFDRGAGDGDASGADLSLCNILAFWFGPSEARIDSMFRRSALMRDKWDEKRGDTTYGGYTIARALEDRTEFYGQKKPKSTQRPKDDDTELSYADELAGFFGLIDDTFVTGWRSSRKSTCRVVLTTRNGLVFDVDSWKAATTSARALNQEIRLQIGTDPAIKKEDLGRLDVLVGQFCKVVAATTAQDRAIELGMAFLQEAETVKVDMKQPAEKWAAFQRMQATHPANKAKAEGISTVTACLVLYDTGTEKRYVRISWFTEYVKAQALSSMAGPILDHIESPGNWSRLNNNQSRMKASEPDGEGRIWQVLYEVPKDWLGGMGDSE